MWMMENIEMTPKLLENRDDIAFLIDRFYKKVIVDDSIGYFFTNVIPISWEKHIPIMVEFWSGILFGNSAYTGNPMVKHIQLNEHSPLKKEHFDRWLMLWTETVQENFFGEKAEEAVTRAEAIAGIMLYKVQMHS